MTAHARFRPPARLSSRHERWVLVTGFLLWLTGGGWVALHYLAPDAAGLGDSMSTLPTWLLRLHGAAAMGFLMVLGSLLPGHIPRAWQTRRNIVTGGLMVAACGVLVATAYGLYYAAGEDTRPWLSAIHWVIGLGAAGALAWHIRVGRHRGRRHGA